MIQVNGFYNGKSRIFFRLTHILSRKNIPYCYLGNYHGGGATSKGRYRIQGAGLSGRRGLGRAPLRMPAGLLTRGFFTHRIQCIGGERVGFGIKQGGVLSYNTLRHRFPVRPENHGDKQHKCDGDKHCHHTPSRVPCHVEPVLHFGSKNSLKKQKSPSVFQ